MNLNNAIVNLRGAPAEIPDCSRDDLPQFFVNMGYKVGAEIGVYNGDFSIKFARVGLRLFAVDPWKNYPGYLYFNDQSKLNSLYRYTKQVLAPYPTSIVIRKTSMEAVIEFENASLDFVYIDANHTFRYIAEDISEWSKKVRSGGIVAGHDYVEYFRPNSPKGICHVIPVINAYIKAYGIKSWYILGRKNIMVNEKRDAWRSWMFVKP